MFQPPGSLAWFLLRFWTYAMIAALSSGLSWLLPNTGMFCGPVSIAPYMSRLVECCSDGANLPEDSAPPPVEKAWHDEQFTR